jgi:hypothetical protein
MFEVNALHYGNPYNYKHTLENLDANSQAMKER